ncbi:MAG: hypothetical protein M3277_06105 [Actinomycetota bacterium]|nr:hypothetical protein [Actinomycetota bacterium]
MPYEYCSTRYARNDTVRNANPGGVPDGNVDFGWFADGDGKCERQRKRGRTDGRGPRAVPAGDIDRDRERLADVDRFSDRDLHGISDGNVDRDRFTNSNLNLHEFSGRDWDGDIVTEPGGIGVPDGRVPRPNARSDPAGQPS